LKVYEIDGHCVKGKTPMHQTLDENGGCRDGTTCFGCFYTDDAGD